MIKDKKITLVIPCKNESKALSILLRKVPSYVDEVIVVDNNSTDDTRLIAKKLGAKVVREIRTDNKGVGYGFAHQKGMKMAKGDYIITLDGDNTYPIKDIKKVIDHVISQNLDFVSCNRFPLKDKRAISGIRQLGVWVLNTEVKLLYGKPMQDILSGMWAVRKTAINKLNIKEGGWNLSPEIKLAALYNPSINFAEFHIDHKYRYNGNSKQVIWVTGFDHLFYILKRRFMVDNFFAKSTIKVTRAMVSIYKNVWAELRGITVQPSTDIV